jgi:hypothetical protein
MVIMPRLTSIILVLVFLTWILPLGVFIAPSKEKLFCDGQRAVCLCSHMAGKHKHPSEPSKTIAKGEASAQKEHSGFSSSHYDAASASGGNNAQAFLYFSRHKNLYSLLVSFPVDHVPKA